MMNKEQELMNRIAQAQFEESKLVEEWKEIEGVDGYMISNLGRVMSLKYGRKTILKGGTAGDNGSYKNIKMNKDGKQYTRLVHRLVAEAFIPNPDGKKEINHINPMDTHNNTVANIEWCTRRENLEHGMCMEKSAKARQKKIKVFINEFDSIEFESHKELYAQLEISKTAVNNAMKKGVTYKGMRFEKVGV